MSDRAYLGSTGISMSGVCGECDGVGELDYPAGDDKWEPGPCNKCNGTGGSNPEKVKKFKELSDFYFQMLMGDDE